jgi:hypothetical protein
MTRLTCAAIAALIFPTGFAIGTAFDHLGRALCRANMLATDGRRHDA